MANMKSLESSMHEVTLSIYSLIQYYHMLVNVNVLWIGAEHNIIYSKIENMKTTSMETVSTGVRDKNKEDYLRSKDKADSKHVLSRNHGTYAISG